MNWSATRQGFLDELEKIAEFNLSGLSPENVMKGSTPPPPMETVGFTKARDILGKAQMAKTSSTRHVKRMLPTQPGIGKLTHQGDESKAEKAKSVGGYGAAGAGLGKLTSEVVLKSPMARRWAEASSKNLSKADLAKRVGKMSDLGWGGMVTGGLGGLAYGAHRLHTKAKQRKEAEMTKVSMTPGTALKSSSQVARPMKNIKSGLSLKTQTSGRIGNKGSIP